MAFGKPLYGGPVHGEIDRRVEQQLSAQGRHAAIARQQTDHGRKVAAGAVATDREPVAVDAYRGARFGDPSGGGEAVVDSRREFVLGRQAVIDRNDRAACGVGEVTAQAVIAIKVADNPAAAMKIDEDR